MKSVDSVAGVSPREFGRLEEKVNGLVKTSDEHTSLLKSMDAKLDGLVTQDQLTDRLIPILQNQANHNSQIMDHKDRLKHIELANTIASSSIWKKIGLAFETNFVGFIGKWLFVIAIAGLIYWVVRQDGFLNKEIQGVKDKGAIICIRGVN